MNIPIKGLFVQASQGFISSQASLCDPVSNDEMNEKSGRTFPHSMLFSVFIRGGFFEPLLTFHPHLAYCLPERKKNKILKFIDTCQ